MKKNDWINYENIQFKITSLGKKAKSKKSRKGQWLYIRDKKTRKTSYQKYEPDYPIQEPLKFKKLWWTGKKLRGKKKTEFYKKEKQKILKIWQKKIKKQEIFNQGTHTTIKTTMNELKNNPLRAYYKILDKVISHNKLKKVLIKEAPKWKELLGYQLTIIGIPDDGIQQEILGEIKDKNKTIQEFIQLYHQNGYKTRAHLDSQKIKTDWPKLKYIYESGKQYKTGTIKNIHIYMSLGN